MSGRPKRKAAHQDVAPTSSAKSVPWSSRKATTMQAPGESDVKGSGRASRPSNSARRTGEQSSHQAEELSASVEPADAIVLEQPIHVETPSKFSGTTARTSMNSNHGRDVSTAFSMVDNLTKLDRAAEDVLALLTPRENNHEALAKITRVFQDDTHLRGRKLKNDRLQFHEVRKTYGEGPYINIKVAVNKTLALSSLQDLKDGPWRPDDIFFRANLASAAEDIQQRRKSDGQYQPALDKMERDFPDLFLHSVVARTATAETGSGISHLLPETFRMALDIRVQFAVKMILGNRGTSTSSSESILRPIFFEESVPRGWSVDGLRTRELTQSQKKQMTNAFEKLQSQIGKGSGLDETINLSSLELHYPMENFVGKYLLWIRDRSAEISDSLETLDTALGVQEAAETFLESHGQDLRANDHGLNMGTSTRNPLHGSTELTPAKRAALQTQLKQLLPTEKGKMWKAAFQGNEVASTSSPITAPNVRSKLRQSIGTTRSQEQSRAQPRPATGSPTLSPSQAKDMASKFHRDLAEGNKENTVPKKGQQSKDVTRGKAYIDAQPNAERITFDTQADDVDAPIFVEQEGGLLDDPSQDTGFEQDRRSAPNKRSAPASGENPGAKRVRIVAAEETHPVPSNSRPEPSMTRPDDYIEANQAAKARTRVHSAQRPAQRRKPWTYDETTYLVRAIQEVGTSWSMIKRLDTNSRFRDRDQVALKDKARNLLVDYLKSGQMLPPNFDNIALNASQKNSLRALGIVLPEEY